MTVSHDPIRRHGSSPAQLDNGLKAVWSPSLDGSPAAFGGTDVISEEATVGDGRHLRRERNRERVVDAYIELLREGVPHPTAADLARRVELTARSVYRYMEDDSDDSSLKQEVGRRIVSQFRMPEPAAGWDGHSLRERIDAVLSFAMDVYDRSAPIMRVARANLATGPVVEDAVQSIRQLVREQIETVFAAELDRLDSPDRHVEVTGLHAFLIFDTLEYMHVYLDRDSVIAVARRHFCLALAAPGDRGDTVPGAN